MGQGESGDDFAPYAGLPRAQSVKGVIEQLIEPIGGMVSYDAGLEFVKKEQAGDYICVTLTKKCTEGP